MVILERGTEVGGTRRDNQYPGAACDIPSNPHSFSFAPNPHWSRGCSGSVEILAYTHDLVARFGLAVCIRFKDTVTALAFDEAKCQWRVSVQGKPELRARSVELAQGPLSNASFPKNVNVSGYPNLFMTFGPDSGPGHNSAPVYMESQIDYLVHGIKMILDGNLKELGVRAEAQAEYNRRIQKRLARTNWNSGCISWYLTEEGLNATMYPGFALQYARQMRQVYEADYRCSAWLR